MFGGKRNTTVKSSVEVDQRKPKSIISQGIAEEHKTSSEHQNPALKADFNKASTGAIEEGSVAQASVITVQAETEGRPEAQSAIEPISKITNETSEQQEERDLPNDNIDDQSSTTRLKKKIILQSKRKEFETKAKKKESSSFYVTKKENKEAKNMNKSSDFQRDINVLKLEKELYSEIAKYGKNVPRH